MDHLGEWVLKAVTLESMLQPTSRFYWPYLLCAALLAVAIFYLRSGGDRSIRRAWRELARADIWLHRSALLDYRLAFVNHLLSAFLIGGGLVSFATVAGIVMLGLTAAFGARVEAPAAGPLAVALFTVCTVVAADLGDYLQHRLQHRIPVLWEFHKVHHSAEVLTPVTTVRVHPVAILFAGVVIPMVSAPVTGAFLYLYDGQVAAVTAFGVNVLTLLYYTIGGALLQHSHIWFNYPAPLTRHLVSPAMHAIHHSRNPRHFNRNYGFLLTWWDRLGGTLHVPSAAELSGLELGLVGAEQSEHRSVLMLYWLPFRNIGRMIAGKARRAPAE